MVYSCANGGGIVKHSEWSNSYMDDDAMRKQQAQSAVQGFKRAKDKAMARNNIISARPAKALVTMY